LLTAAGAIAGAVGGAAVVGAVGAVGTAGTGAPGAPGAPGTDGAATVHCGRCSCNRPEYRVSNLISRYNWNSSQVRD